MIVPMARDRRRVVPPGRGTRWWTLHPGESVRFTAVGVLESAYAAATGSARQPGCVHHEAAQLADRPELVVDGGGERVDVLGARGPVGLDDDHPGLGVGPRVDAGTLVERQERHATASSRWSMPK